MIKRKKIKEVGDIFDKWGRERVECDIPRGWWKCLDGLFKEFHTMGYTPDNYRIDGISIRHGSMMVKTNPICTPTVMKRLLWWEEKSGRTCVNCGKVTKDQDIRDGGVWPVCLNCQ